MNFYSLNKKSPPVNFREATLLGQAPDKGLYFPEEIPILPKSFIEQIAQYPREEIAFRVIEPYVGESIPQNELKRIIADTLCFDFPLVKITEEIYSLELYHGPTLAFKDVGARFMSRCLGYFFRGEKRKITVLVATSGDTGGAVANGFHGLDGVDVIILYPSGKVSPVQELQLTTLGENISALEVQGSFDDCQSLVKQAFGDTALRERIFLTSANSINVARWLPQQFYYFFAWQQWPDQSNAPAISVPSGNFGNICAGLLAKQSGLPLDHFIAACNANRVIPDFLQTKKLEVKPAIATMSNAMDVGNPSNFVRILELFHQEFNELTRNLSSYSISDDENQKDDLTLFKFNYLADLRRRRALKMARGSSPRKGIIPETAQIFKILRQC
jgi:threonine synthase